VAAVHAYTQGGTCCAQPETVITRYNTAQTKLSAAGSSLPIWSTEGGYGQQAPSEPDLDLQAAFVARYYLLGWASGFKWLYWYAWDNPSWGTLWNANGVNGCSDGGSGTGCVTKAGTAYSQVYGWMAGNTMTGPCASSGTIWTCELTGPSGIKELAVWDSAQTCSSGVCTTANHSFGSQYLRYQDLGGNSVAITDGNGTAPLGAKPLLLISNVSNRTIISGGRIM